MPAVIALLAYFLFGETLNALSPFCMVVYAVGVVLASRAAARKPAVGNVAASVGAES